MRYIPHSGIRIFFLLLLLLNAGSLFSQTPTITLGNVAATPGATVTVPVRVTGFSDIRAFQFWISYDADVLDFITLTNINPKFGSTNIGELDNVMKFTYFNLFSLESLADNEKLFDISMQYCSDLSACAASGGSSPLSFITDESYVVRDSEWIDYAIYNNGSVYSNTALYTLFIDTSGTGSVKVNGTTYAGPLTVAGGTTVSLEAVGGPGYIFSNWSGDLSGSANPSNLLMNGDKHVTANFIEGTVTTYTLTLNITGNGTVTVNSVPYTGPVTVNEGTTLSLAATPAEGHQFIGWGGALSGTVTPRSLLMNGNKTVSAAFAIKQYTLTVNVSGQGGVNVNSNPYTVPLTFNHGETPSLQALAAVGWHFTGWSGALTGTTNPQYLLMNANKTVTATYAPNQHTLTVATTGSGTVRVNSTTYTTPRTFNYGDNPSLQAMPAAGWQFSGWSGDLSGTANPQNLLINSNKSVTATFTLIPIVQYTLTLSITGSGTVTVNGAAYVAPVTVNSGTVLSLAATPGTGWVFGGWSGSLAGNTTPQNITMNSNKSVTATFLDSPPVQYTLTMNTSGNGTVTVNSNPYTGPVTVTAGTVLSLAASPASGWQFSGWSGGGLTGTTTPQNITMSANRSVTASFTQILPNQYTLTLNTSGSGTVTVNGNPYTGPVTVNEGTTLALAATATPGWEFSGWSGALAGTTTPQNLLMNGNKSVTATFAEVQSSQYTLTLTTTGSGTVTVNGNPYTVPVTVDAGTILSLAATPATGWQFAGWGGALSGTASPQNLIMDGHKNLSASFELRQFTLTIATTGAGSVLVNGVAYTGPLSFAYGSTPELQAVAGDFHSFTEWGIGLAGPTNPQSIVMNNNKLVLANFAPFQYTLTLNTVGQGHVEVDGVPYTTPLTYNHGSTPLVRASAAAGWQFDGWSGHLTGTANPQALTMDSNKSATATFSEIPPDFYTLTVHIEGSGAVMVNDINYVTPQGFEDGTQLAITALPEEGWYFSGWEGDLTGTDNPEQLLVNSPKDVTATFARYQYVLTANHTGSGTIRVDGEEYIEPLTFWHGDLPLIEALPAEGWQFDGWSGDLSGTENPASLLMVSDKTVSASFSEIPPAVYTLTIEYDGSGVVIINGEPYTGPVVAVDGTAFMLDAIAEAGWKFEGWSGDHSGTLASTVLTLDGNKTVTATFSEIPPAIYTLILGHEGNGTLEVNGETYTAPISAEVGTIIVLEAFPEEGWQFDGWSGDLTSQANPFVFELDAAKVITATFSEIPPAVYTLTVEYEGNGAVLVNAAAYTGPVSVEEGTILLLDALPDEGWLFEEWSGYLSGSTTPMALLMDGNKTVKATFLPLQYTLDIVIVGEGTVSVNDIPYTEQLLLMHGHTAALMATPAEGWVFDGWSGDLVSANTEASLAMDGNKSVVATFHELPPPVYSVTFVVGLEDGTPVSDATIHFAGSDYPAGQYVFNDLDPGDYPYVVSKAGYFDTSGSLVVTDQDVIQLVVLQIDDTGLKHNPSITLNVYPNPAKAWLTIESSQAIAEVRIIDMLGQTVLSEGSENTRSYRLDIGHIRNGVYFLHAFTPGGIQTERVIINN